MDFKERSTLGGALYTNWNQFRTSGVIHRFIATVLIDVDQKINDFLRAVWMQQSQYCSMTNAAVFL